MRCSPLLSPQEGAAALNFTHGRAGGQNAGAPSVSLNLHPSFSVPCVFPVIAEVTYKLDFLYTYPRLRSYATFLSFRYVIPALLSPVPSPTAPLPFSLCPFFSSFH